MSDRQSATANPGDGPSLNDQPFVSSGPPRELPAGKAFKADPDTWYHLKVHFKDRHGKFVDSFLYPLGQNPSTSFWDYMAFNSPDGLQPAKFKLHQRPDGWADWEMDDGNYLSIKATGWFYRASHYRTGCLVVDGMLYNNYWSGPAGYAYRDVLVPAAYYVGMDLPVFTCELVPVSVPASVPA